MVVPTSGELIMYDKSNIKLRLNKPNQAPQKPILSEISLPNFDISNLTKELFDTTADKCAKAISANKKSNKPTQIRRFYEELILLEERATISEEAFKDTLPFIYMIKSKVAYAKGRGNVDNIFEDFMNKLINQITDIKTLKNAKLFMEAMMGFFKSYKPKD